MSPPTRDEDEQQQQQAAREGEEVSSEDLNQNTISNWPFERW